MILPQDQVLAPLSPQEYDARLVKRFVGGDESAFVEIVCRYKEKILVVSLGRLRIRVDAEEITQDTFIRAYRGLARFRGDSSLSTWLHRIALNLARNRFQYNRRRRKDLMLSLSDQIGHADSFTYADVIPSEEHEASYASELKEFEDIVASCMNLLSEQHREILTLRNILNRSYDEIAVTLGVSVGTVKSRIARAREKLRALIEAKYGQRIEWGDNWHIPRQAVEQDPLAC